MWFMYSGRVVQTFTEDGQIKCTDKQVGTLFYIHIFFNMSSDIGSTGKHVNAASPKACTTLYNTQGHSLPKRSNQDDCDDNFSYIGSTAQQQQQNMF